MINLMVVSKVLKEHQLFVKYSKCVFWLRSLTFHGHIISSKGVEVHPRKTEAVKNGHKPLTPTDIRSFLRLGGYYKRFVDGFASIASPLTTLTQNSNNLSAPRHV